MRGKFVFTSLGVAIACAAAIEAATGFTLSEPPKVAFLYFAEKTDTKYQFAFYRGGAPAMQDLLSGSIDIMCAEASQTLAHVTAGKMKAFAVMGQKRYAPLKDVPTIVEQGFPNLVVEDWVGLAVKSGTPNDVVVRLNAAINKALQTPKVRDAFARVGAEPAGGTSAELGDLITSQVAYWGKVVKDSGIKMQQ